MPDPFVNADPFVNDPFVNSDRPNVRSLKIADVPAPGRARTPEQEAEAARAPRPDIAGAHGGGSRAPIVLAHHAASAIRDERVADVGEDGGSAGGAASSPVGGGAPEAGGLSDAARASGSGDGSWAGRADGLLKAAKGLGVGSPRPGDPPRLSLADHPVGRRILLDRKVAAGVRGALSRLGASGRRVSPEEAEAAAASVLEENGVEATPDEVRLQLALADAPAQPPPSPQRMADTLRKLEEDLPDAPTLDRLAKEAEKPPPRPGGPLPRNIVEAYRRNRAALEKAERDFGVDPADALAICRVETNCGRNTGDHPVRDVLEAVRSRNPEGSAKRRQAERDLASLARLHAAGEVDMTKLRGSYAGALGITQFLPSSWEAYARSPTGGKRDPFEHGAALYSTAHYLHRHGYSRDVSRAIWGYNHSQEYVDKVLATSEQVKQAIGAQAAGR